MATLQITVPDSAVTRIRAAFSRLDPATQIFRPATLVEVQDVLKDVIRAKVNEMEGQQAARTAQQAIQNEVKDW